MVLKAYRGRGKAAPSKKERRNSKGKTSKRFTHG